MNRNERRRIKKEINIFADVINIVKQYFPELEEKFEDLSDTRHQSYVEYSMSVIMMTRLIALLCGIKSMKEVTEQFNTEESIENIGQILGIQIKELPHHDTINDVFEEIKLEELRKIQKYMVTRLLRSKMFDKYRYKGKYFQIVVDGTGMVSFKQKHCKHCLRKVYHEGEEEEYTTYYHYVLEAKLVVGEMVISIDTEFVENEDEDVEKQDCELRAFYRMAERLKKEYPRLPMIITGDALYACEPVIRTCLENKWEYILRFKKERMKLLGEEIEGLEEVEGNRKGIPYWNKLVYGEVQIQKEVNILKQYEEKAGKTTEFMWMVSFSITEKNKKELAHYGRQRWKIENEGFNEQKKGTFNIEHTYSRNYNAMKAHYFFIQYAHTIRQLLEKGIKVLLEIKMTKKEVSAAITQTLTTTVQNLTIPIKIQLRFNTS